MQNAGEELRKAIKGYTVTCAFISLGYPHDEDSTAFVLPISHTPEDLEAYLNKLDGIRYDSGYGGQNLFGNVWFSNGEWLSRGEYDGSEWWMHVKCPNVPAECIDLTGNEG
jgi:hypothetical protein